MGARYLTRRLLGTIPALFGVLVVTFVIVRALPGDPALLMAGEAATPERVAEIRHDLGLDRPLPQQFVSYATKVARGDLGRSTSQGKSVNAVILERVGPTILLSGTAMVVSTLFGLFLGSAAARRPFGRLDLAINSVALIGYAVPAFWLGQLAVLFLSVRWGLFPIQGYTDLRRQLTGVDHLGDVGYHLVLPSLALAVSEIALLTRVTRTGLLQEQGQDYIRTARAKGLPEDKVQGQALRNALLPVVTVLGNRIGFLVSGAVVIEAVFGWPGLGSVITSAARQADGETMVGLVLVVAFGITMANLLTDLLYGWIDPRVRHR